MKHIIHIALLLTIVSCNAQPDESNMNTIDQYLQSLIDKGKTPSVCYIHFNADSIVHSFAGGLADIQNDVLTTDQTLYAGFSVTKTFTALAILQLAEKKKLKLDDKAIDYIREFPYSTEITIKDLLTHTAGIPNPLPLKWVHSPEQGSRFNRNAFFREVMQKNSKQKSDPNEKFKYSNIGYYLLGLIIENVSESSYEDYIHNNIIASLKLEPDDLGFSFTKDNPHAKGYQKKYSIMNFLLGFLIDKKQYVDKTEGKWISFKGMKINGPSYGGLVGTPKSFMKYVQDLLKPNSQLLSDKSKKLLFTENITNSNKETGMCLSWFKSQLNGQTYYTHVGGGAGYYCEIRIYPEQRVGSVIMFNRTGVKDEKVLDAVDSNFGY